MKALILHIYSFFILLCLSAPASVQAIHSSSQHSAARRSFSGHRRAGEPIEVGLPPVDPVESPSATTKLGDPVSISLDPSSESSTASETASASESESVSVSTSASESISTSKSVSSSASASESESITVGPTSSASESETITSVSASESISTSKSVSSSASASESESITVGPTSSASESETITSAPSSSTGITDIGGGLSSILSSILSPIIDPPASSTSEESSIQTPPPSSSADSSESVTESSTGITLLPSIPLSSLSISLTLFPDPPSSSAEPPSSSVDPPPSSSVEPSGPSSEPSAPPPSSSIEPPPSSSSEEPAGPTPSSSSESISFPSGSSTTSDISTSVSVSVTTVISIPSDLSFILSETSLAADTLTTSSPSLTLTDPDQATTTLETTISLTASAVPTAILPEGLPNRIYPNDGLAKKNAAGDKVLVSILFDAGLNWPHVVSSSLSASQIFGFMPIIIGTATGVPVSEVENWALQVNVPSSYKGPADQVQLGTVYLAYIDPATVDTLAAQIKATTSPFYNGVQNDVAKQLAAHVVKGFNVQSVQDPNDDSGSSGASNTGATGNDGKQRQDAIIGVVSALGAVAVLVLIFLVYRSLKRRRELAHRRLSDPPDAYLVGARPEGREFDQDSVGGQRRRSFYFAEDSLRDSPHQQHGEYSEVARNSPSPAGGMRERRVVPNVISAPVLQESSMNW